MAIVIIGTFLLTLAIVLGAVWLFVGQPEARDARVLRRRLSSDSPSAADDVGLLAEETPLSMLPWLDRGLLRIRGSVEPLRRMIDRSALRVTPGGVLLGCILMALLAYTVMRFLSPLPAMAIIGALAAAPLPMLFVGFRARQRMARFEEHFPVAIDLVTRALRAGHSLPSAMELVGKEVPDPVGAEFRLLFERQNYGMSMEDALRGFGARVPLVDARFFVTAVLTQREVGGNLAEVLENLARVIRERFGVRREIRVSSAHGRITGWILGLLPPVLAFVLFTLDPEHMLLLVRDPVGMQMVMVAVTLQLAGVFIIRKIVNVEY